MSRLLPPSTDRVKFEKGGVLIGKQISSATIMFHTDRERVLTETSIDYYLIQSKELDKFIYNSWAMAAEFCPEMVFSQPDREKSKEVAKHIKALFDLK